MTQRSSVLYQLWNAARTRDHYSSVCFGPVFLNLWAMTWAIV